MPDLLNKIMTTTIVRKAEFLCPICRDIKAEKKIKSDNYLIFYCPSCRIEFNANFPPKETIEYSFSKEYYRDIQKESFAMQEKDYRSDASFTYYKQGLDQLEKITDGRNLLDIGAGLGAFMKAAHDFGWKVQGVEVSAYAAEFIQKKYGFNIYREDSSSQDLLSASFDVISFWDVIEHVEFPKDNLIRAHKMLKPGGAILITSDNYNSLITYIARAFYFASLGLFIYPIKRVFTPYNKTYFNDKSMRRLLKEMGFEIVFFQKMQYPISRLKLNNIEKAILNLLYKIESFFKLESQFMFIAKKPTETCL